MTPQQQAQSIEKLRQTLKETGHIIVLQDPTLKVKKTQKSATQRPSKVPVKDCKKATTDDMEMEGAKNDEEVKV